MSKNLFRKGLVAASLVALGSTAIAGTPAFAADITTTSALGSATNFTGLYSQSFALNTIASATGNLLYNISGVTAGDVATGDSQSVTEHVKDATSYLEAGRTATDGTTYDATDSSFTFAAANDSDGAIHYNHLTLKLTNAVAATKTVKVIAWVDTIVNGVKDPSETASTTNVTFVKDSSVTATTVLTQPVLGSSSHKATVTLDNGVNFKQVDGAVTVDFTKAVSGTVTNVATDVSAGYDSLKNAFIATATELVVAGVYSAQAKVFGGASGAKVSVAVATKTVATGGVGLATATVDENLKKSGDNFVVRAGAASAITFTSQLTKSGTFGEANFVAVGAGVVAKVVVARGIALDSSSVITAAGKTISSTDTADIEFNVLTNAKGEAVFTIANSGAVDTDSYTFTVSAEGEAAATQTVTYEKARFDFRGTLSNRSIVIGGSAVVTTRIADQFGVAPANGKFAVVISRSDDNATRAADDEASFAFTVPVVNGIATATLVDNGAKTGNDVVLFTLYNVLPGGGNGTSTGSNKRFTLTYDTAANVNVTKVTAALDNNGIDRLDSAPVPSASPIALEPKDFAVTNTSIPNSSAPAYATVATLTGNATNASGAGIQGAAVTISAPGLAFTDGTQYTVGSITVVSGADGFYSVAVFSHTRGKQSITVAVGSATATATILFTSAGTSKITLDAPSVLQSGADLKVLVTFRDKWNNIVSTDQSWGLDGFYIVGTGAGYHSAIDSGYYLYGNLAPVSIDAKDAQFYSTYTGPVTASGTFTINASILGATPAITATTSTVISDLAGAAKAAAELVAKAKTVTATPSVTSAQTGRSVDVAVKALNAAGTAAAGRTVTFTSIGAGSLTASSAVTDANGVATVKLLAGASDNGDAVVTATIDGVTATASTVTFGTTDAQIDIVANRVTAVTSFSKGKTVAFYVDGVKKWSKVSTSDSDVVVNYNLKKGAHTVTVKVSGGFVTTEKFIVK